MKKELALILGLGLLALPATTGMSQAAKAPAAPPAPVSPPPPEAMEENVVEIVNQNRQLAQDAANQARAGYSQRLQSIVTKIGPGGNGTLVIPKDEADAKSIGESQEDMGIMAHILDKIASSPDGKGRRAMGIPVRISFDGGSARNLYIDGYGAIFFLNVGYPLSAPPPSKEPAEAKKETPSEWDEARRELTQPGQVNSEWKVYGEYGKAVEAFSGSPGEPYDAGRVEDLQKSLVTELKNASHLRALKSHETVTIVVTGRGGSTGGPKVIALQKPGGSGAGGGGFGGSSSGGSSGNSFSYRAVSSERSPGPEARGNQMIIRAEKSDIEAFDKGKLSYDEFRKKATVLIY